MVPYDKDSDSAGNLGPGTQPGKTGGSAATPNTAIPPATDVPKPGATTVPASGTGLSTGTGLYSADKDRVPVNYSGYTPGNVDTSKVPDFTAGRLDMGAYDPTKAYQTVNTKFSTGTAQGYDASQASTTHWNVDKNQLAANQIDGIIAANSPLMQRAAAKANEQSNSRGLLNSSLAVGAAQGAVMDQATTIGVHDADTYANSAKFNADADNSMAQFNTGQTNASRQFSANAQNQMSMANMDAANAAYRADADNENTRLRNLQSLQHQAATTNLQTKTDVDKQKYAASMDAAMRNADASNKFTLAKMDAEVQANLKDIDNRYKVGLQTQSNMQSAYQQYLQAVQAVMTDKDMDEGAKQHAVDMLTSNFNANMDMLSNLSGLKLGNILSGQPTNTGSSGAASGGGSGGISGTSSGDGSDWDPGGKPWETNYPGASSRPDAQPWDDEQSGLLARNMGRASGVAAQV